MKARRCSRLWQVEAVGDGRISGSEAESARSHIARCPDCSREQEALGTLGELLRAHDSEPDRISVRRLRNAILARADEELRSEWHGRPRSRVTVLAAVLVALVALGFGVRSLRDRAPSIAAPASDPISISPSGAQWTRSSSPGVETIDLVDVALSIATHLPAGTKMIVHVPDGEIEDVGTVFRVTVHERRTREISVAEGTVTFRPVGATEVRIVPGREWTLAPETASTDAPTAPSVPLAEAEHVAAAPAAPLASHEKARRAHGISPPLDTNRGVTQPEDARKGQTGNAFPGEDETYLRIVALLREDRGEEARVAAFHYLKRFPNGFRREEVERIARRR